MAMRYLLYAAAPWAGVDCPVMTSPGDLLDFRGELRVSGERRPEVSEGDERRELSGYGPCAL